MPYQTRDHTADVRVHVTAKTRRRLFSECTRMLRDLLQPVYPAKKDSDAFDERITLLSSDTTGLLIDFLNEIVSRSMTKRAVFTLKRFSEFSPTSLSAEVVGVPVERFGCDVKAVTYHEADVGKNEKGEWETMIVFDI